MRIKGSILLVLDERVPQLTEDGKPCFVEDVVVAGTLASLRGYSDAAPPPAAPPARTVRCHPDTWAGLTRRQRHVFYVLNEDHPTPADERSTR